MNPKLHQQCLQLNYYTSPGWFSEIIFLRATRNRLIRSGVQVLSTCVLCNTLDESSDVHTLVKIQKSDIDLSGFL
uniref:Uncharacterized protein n=1 Tax=Daucus carota subsp. sativus TaxID=79200 RepID=A0A166BZX2_DAUCS